MLTLTPEEWQQLKAILDEAADLAPPSRLAFLEHQCAEKPHLLPIAQQLLAHHQEDSDHQSPHRYWWNLEKPSPHDRIGTHIGPYVIHQCLGEGGMGVVYAAERHFEGGVQKVALKILKQGLDTQAIVARFHGERRILARLDHPNIANFIDAGKTRDHLPYLVMNLVQGQSLFAYCRSMKPSLDERLLIFRKICQTLHYAHQNLIVHQDLKPNNLLITDEGDPRLLDFGIAEVICPEPDAQPPGEGIQLLTPEYASPEQLRGESATTASDIYSLGMLFYELIAGVKPFDQRSLSPNALSEEWINPSQKLAMNLKKNLHDLPLLGDDFSLFSKAQINQRIKRLKGDLDRIAHKAMHPDPEQRYTSAMQMAVDLDLYLAGKPILAGPDSFSYVFRKWLKRHQLGVGFSTAIALLVTIFTFFSLRQHQDLKTQIQITASERDKSQHISSFLREVFAAAEPFEGDLCDITATMLIQDTAQKLAKHPYLSPKMKAELMETIPTIYGESNLSLSPQNLLHQSLINFANSNLQAPLQAAEIHHILAHYDLKRGDLDQAQQRFLQARQTYIVLDQKPEDDLADLESSLGEIARKLGDHHQAKTHQAMALNYLRRDSQASIGERAKIYKRLGAALARTGELAKAIDAYENGVAALAGQADYSVARAEIQTDLGLLYRKLGQHERAIQIFEDAISLRRNRFGQLSPWTANMYQELAWTYLDHGALAKAEEAFTACYEIRKETMDTNHPEFLVAQRNLAGTQILRGHFSLATTHLDNLIRSQTKTASSPCKPTLKKLFMYQAQAHLGNQYWDAGETHLEQALAIQQFHAQTNTADESLLFLYQSHLATSRQQWQHAITLAHQAISQLEALFGPESVHLGRAFLQLATTYRQQGDLKQAWHQASRALIIFSLDMPRNRPFLADSLLLLAQLAEAQDDLLQAHGLYEEARGYLTASYGHDSPKMAGLEIPRSENLEGLNSGSDATTY